MRATFFTSTSASAPGPRDRTSPVTRSTSASLGRPLLATILAQVRAGTPVSAANASSAGRRLALASATRSSTSAGVSLASLRGRLPRSDMASPRRARASHLRAVWRLTPAIAAASVTRTPPPTRSQSSSLPLGAGLALGRWDMGGPSSLRF